MVVFCPPLVMASPWLSCAKRAECWAAVGSGLEMSSKNAGGGPGGGGGGGGQGPPDEELKSEEGATGPLGTTESLRRYTELLADKMTNLAYACSSW